MSGMCKQASSLCKQASKDYGSRFSDRGTTIAESCELLSGTLIMGAETTF